MKIDEKGNKMCDIHVQTPSEECNYVMTTCRNRKKYL